MTKHRISKALREVWDWKDECYREVAGLSIRDALKKRLADASRKAAKLGFTATVGKQVKPMIVAEDAAHYGKKKK